MEEVTEEQLVEEEDVGASSIAVDNDDDDMSGDIFAGFEDLPASPPSRRRVTKKK